MSLVAALLLVAVTAQPTKERLAELFWNSCVDQKPLPADFIEGSWKDAPSGMRRRFDGASHLEIRKGAGDLRALVVRATFVPAKNHAIRRCAVLSRDWSAMDADELVNARAEKKPYAEVKPMTMPYNPGTSFRYAGGQLATYDLGWAIDFQQDYTRGRAEYVRYTNLRAQELLEKERALQAEYAKSQKARRK